MEWHSAGGIWIKKCDKGIIFCVKNGKKQSIQDIPWIKATNPLQECKNLINTTVFFNRFFWPKGLRKNKQFFKEFVVLKLVSKMRFVAKFTQLLLLATINARVIFGGKFSTKGQGYKRYSLVPGFDAKKVVKRTNSLIG